MYKECLLGYRRFLFLFCFCFVVVVFCDDKKRFTDLSSVDLAQIVEILIFIWTYLLLIGQNTSDMYMGKVP